MVGGKEQPTHTTPGTSLSGGRFVRVLGLALKGQLMHDRRLLAQWRCKGQNYRQDQYPCSFVGEQGALVQV
jgi:hypothetical protein